LGGVGGWRGGVVGERATRTPTTARAFHRRPVGGRRRRRLGLRQTRGTFNQIKTLKCQVPQPEVVVRSAAGRTRSASPMPPPRTPRARVVSSCVDVRIKGNLPSTTAAGRCRGCGRRGLDGHPTSTGSGPGRRRPRGHPHPRRTGQLARLLAEFRKPIGALGGNPTGCSPPSPRRPGQDQQGGPHQVSRR